MRTRRCTRFASGQSSHSYIKRTVNANHVTLAFPFLLQSVEVLWDLSVGYQNLIPLVGNTPTPSSWTAAGGSAPRFAPEIHCELKARGSLTIPVSRWGADSRAATPSSLKLQSRTRASVTSCSPRWWSWSSPNLSLNYPFVTKYLQIKYLQRRNVRAQLHIYTTHLLQMWLKQLANTAKHYWNYVLACKMKLISIFNLHSFERPVVYIK